ncbi:DUF1846 domain-containing protein [Candidatus Dojkabacteria bacterium]|jgi:uncharacterized protein (UPF0371 family)|nr:DUF1846 domain-containing protein [Candidatus Dojkabacteria bacterium]
MESYDTIKYKKKGFDNKRYLDLQGKAIKNRINKFKDGRLYLEIGGKLLFDPHAQRVLPGFESENKVKLLKSFEKTSEFIFCVNAYDVSNNRKLDSTNKGYIKSTINLINTLKHRFKSKISVSINLVNDENISFANEYADFLKKLGFTSYLRYEISGYPKSKSILGENGFGKDEYVPVTKELVIVTGAASNSGKLSTCLGQIYKEHLKGIKSGYAKYETFPIWNLPIHHPVNLAYEAATADIGDFNVIDVYHQHAHNTYAVNYNRDIKAFKILRDFIEEIADNSNYLSHYQSPTDMGINMDGFCIKDDEIISIASLREIERRIQWYNKVKEFDAVKKCIELHKKAMKYIEKKKYDLEISI